MFNKMFDALNKGRKGNEYEDGLDTEEVGARPGVGQPGSQRGSQQSSQQGGWSSRREGTGHGSMERSSDSSTAQPDPDGPRYEVEDHVASGSEGHVYVVADRSLRRRVAMKVLRHEKADNPKGQRRFISEARHTAALQHPSIPAIYDFGANSEGQLYFTMRLVEGRTLRDILQSLRDGTPEAQDEWTRHKLVQVLLQVANAVSFAHARGLLHRDLKPANIAVGEHGEVLVLDWGLSKRVEDHEGFMIGMDTSMTANMTQAGALVGTPLYMAPEQAEGLRDLDERTDVFALGALLYEILTLRPPHEGTTVKQVVRNARVCKVKLPADRVPGVDAPRVLEKTAMRALSKDPLDRHPTVAEFANDLQGFIEGRREAAERRQEAKVLLKKALDLLEKSRHAAREAEIHETEAGVLRETTPPWAPLEEKRLFWQAEDLAGLQKVNSAHLYSRAMDRVSRALALDPENKTARGFMAKLCFERYLEATHKGAEIEALWLRRLVERYGDGEFGSALEEVGNVEIDSNPPGAEVAIEGFVEEDRRLVGAGAEPTGRTPAALAELPVGHYVVTVSHPGYATARLPLEIERGGAHRLEVDLLPADEVPEGFAWIPAGSFKTGDGPTFEERVLPGYLIQERPVLMTEYAIWLDELHAQDPSSVRPHVPWAETHGRLLELVDGKHAFAPPSPIASRPIEEVPDMPVVGITRDSAMEYAAWFGRKIRRRVHLPTAQQWEKAARGTDGRLYPWGRHFEATFCSMAKSTPARPSLRPVGAFPTDVSPYGVRDVAGGVRDWCKEDVHAERNWAECRGGAWHLEAEDCALTARALVDRSTKSAGIGLRVVVSLTEVADDEEF